jgi:hypothetical protein
MDEISRNIQSEPEKGCPVEPEAEMECTPFLGAVTVSAELPVEINGRQVLIGPGETIRWLLSEQGMSECESNPGGLRIKREFFNRLVPVDFDLKTDSILDLVPLANDRIACLGGSTSAR